MLDDTMDRLKELDRNLDGAAVARAVAIDLGARDRPLRDRTDPIIGVLRTELVDLLVQPHAPTGSGRPSLAAQRRAGRCHLSFDEGYLVGRIGLDTHRLPLLWSGLRGDDAARAPVTTHLARLRSLVLSPAVMAAYTATGRLAPLLRDLVDETRGIPADQAAQFAALGLLTAAAEWSVLVSGADHRVELLHARC